MKIKNHLRYMRLWVTFLSATVVCAQEAVLITQDGKPVAEVVAVDGGSASEAFAVTEFVEHVQKMSGAALQVVKVKAAGELTKATTSRVFIGNKTCQAFFPDLDLKGLGDEGFIIQTKGKDLIIAGGELRGTLYGVYTFLEDYCDVHWWSPDDIDIPATPTVRVGALNRRDVPTLEMRDAMYHNASTSKGAVWYARNKLNGMSFDPLKNPVFDKIGNSYYRHFVGPFAHSQYDLMADSGIKVEPEMMALLQSGKRDPWQPCSTHPKVIEATTKTVLDLYRKDPLTPYVVIAHMDCGIPPSSWNHCTCPRCKAIDEEEGSHSGQFYYLVNKVAEALEKEFPRGRILCSAYIWTWDPPKKMKIRDNVVIRLAAIQLNQFYPIANSKDPANQQIEKAFIDWQKATQNAYVFTYVSGFTQYNVPWPNFDAILPNIGYFASMPMTKAVVCQGAHTSFGSDFFALRVWTIGQKLWNPSLDSRMLTETFLKKYYGPAADIVREYIDVLHNEVRTTAVPANLSQLQDMRQNNVPGTDAKNVAKLEAIARRAEAAVADAGGMEKYQQRLRHFHMPLWYIMLRRGPMSATWKAVEEEVGPLDIEKMAASFVQVARETPVTGLSENERSIENFLKWLPRYAALVKTNGPVLTPEAKQAAGLKLYLPSWGLSDCFTPANQRQEDPATPDGWTYRIFFRSYKARHAISVEDIPVGKKYRVHVKLRSGDIPCGFQVIFGNPRIKVAAADVSKQYQVYSSKPFLSRPEDRRDLIIVADYPGPLNKEAAVYVESVWFTEEP